jgi:tRNA pseudouridine38-40 synthase
MKRPPHSRRYRLTLEYDGSNFSGWQKQTDARTVQGDLLKAAQRVFAVLPEDVQGCGRTDAGVHALEYVAHIEVASRLPAAEALRRFNLELPKDMAVRAVELVEESFHARHSCVARSYLYRLRTGKSAFGKRYSWWLQEAVDAVEMSRAALLFAGMHDFRAFAERQELKKSTRVLVHHVGVFQNDDLLSVRVVGSHFLWHMVRRMVGALVAVGRGELTPADIHGLLGPDAVLPAGLTAPAAGLFFEKAFYSDEELRRFLAQPPLKAVTIA